MKTIEQQVKEKQKEVDALKEKAVKTIMDEGTSFSPTGDMRRTIEAAVHLAVQKAYLITDPEALTEAHQAGIDELIHSWNKAEQRLDGTKQGAINCIEQFRNTIKALQDNK